MADKNVNCDVTISSALQFGEFANAFRILPEGGQECFLDFCVYSAENNIAKVVARIRVHVTFLKVMRERLSLALTDLSGEKSTPFVMTNGVLRDAQNQIILFNGTATDQ